MAKQQGPNPAKPEQKNLPKRPPVRAGILPQVEEITELAQQELAALPGGLRAAVGDGTLNSQANRLSDVRIPTAQRQTIARQIGALQGNEHLQRVAAKAKPTSPVVSKDGGNNGKRTIVQAAPAQHSSVGAANKSGRGNGGSSGGNGHQDDLLSVTGMEALEGMGGNGKTAAAATEPPPRGKKSLGAGFSSQLSVDPIEGAVAIQRKAVVQRGIAEDVANAILERVVGSASSEQSGIDTAESTAGSDVESEATSGQ